MSRGWGMGGGRKDAVFIKLSSMFKNKVILLMFPILQSNVCCTSWPAYTFLSQEILDTNPCSIVLFSFLVHFAAKAEVGLTSIG